MMPMEHSEDMESHRMMDGVFAELKAEAAALGADETVRGRRTGTALVAGRLVGLTRSCRVSAQFLQAKSIAMFEKFEGEHRAVVERFGR